MNSNFFIVLCAALFLCLSAALYFVVPNQQARLDIDSFGYDAIGVHFSKTRDLVDPADQSNHPVTMVGYPLLLGFVYSLFSHSFIPVIVLQLFFALFSGWLLYRIATILFSVPIALLSIGLFTLNLGFLIYPQFILTDILLVMLLLIFIQRLLTFFCNNRLLDLAYSGLFLGLSILVKPAALFFVWVMAGFLLFFLDGPIVYRLKNIIAFLFCFYVPVVGYMVRNYFVYDHFKLAPMMYENMYGYLLADVKGLLEHKPLNEAMRELPALAGHDRFNAENWQPRRVLFRQLLRAHPFIFMYSWLRNITKTFFGLFTIHLKILVDPSLKGASCSFFGYQGTIVQRFWYYITWGTQSYLLNFIALFETIWQIIRYFFIFVALIFLLLKREFFVVSFMGLYISYFAFITGHGGCARYRLPFEPFLIMLTALGIWVMVKIVVKKKFV